MKIHEQCLPCMLNQVIRTLNMLGVQNREAIYRDTLLEMARIDYNASSPVPWGKIYTMLKERIGTDDPYREIRRKFDALLMKEADAFRDSIRRSEEPLRQAIRLSIAGNLIDFAAEGEPDREVVLHTLHTADAMVLYKDETDVLRGRLLHAKTMTVLGDNCGEIVMDRLLIEECKRINPALQVTYAVKGTAVINDVTEEEAYGIGMDTVAAILPNGDAAPGTVLTDVSEAFLENYRNADVVIAKGQGNYESVSEDTEREVFCLLLAKCGHLARAMGVPARSAVCMRINPAEQ